MVIREERLPAAAARIVRRGQTATSSCAACWRRRTPAAIVTRPRGLHHFFGRGEALSGFLWGLVTLPAWILIFKLYGLYDRDAQACKPFHRRRPPVALPFARDRQRSGLWLFFAYVAPTRLGFTEGLVFFGVALVGIFVLRVPLARAVEQVRSSRPSASSSSAEARWPSFLARKIRLHPEYELDPIGYVDARRRTRAHRPPVPRDLSESTQSVTTEDDRARADPLARG